MTHNLDQIISFLEEIEFKFSRIRELPEGDKEFIVDSQINVTHGYGTKRIIFVKHLVLDRIDDFSFDLKPKDQLMLEEFIQYFGDYKLLPANSGGRFSAAFPTVELNDQVSYVIFAEAYGGMDAQTKITTLSVRFDFK